MSAWSEPPFRRCLAISGILLGLGLLTAVALIIDAQRMDTSAREHNASIRKQLAFVLQSRNQVKSLLPSNDQGQRPDSEVIARINQSLLQAGLPLSKFIGTQPLGEQTSAEADGRAFRIAQVQLRFSSLNTAELGSWMHAWRNHHAPWRVVECQLIHRQSEETDHYDATIVIAAPHAAQE